MGGALARPTCGTCGRSSKKTKVTRLLECAHWVYTNHACTYLLTGYHPISCRRPAHLHTKAPTQTKRFLDKTADAGRAASSPSAFKLKRRKYLLSRARQPMIIVDRSDAGVSSAPSPSANASRTGSGDIRYAIAAIRDEVQPARVPGCRNANGAFVRGRRLGWPLVDSTRLGFETRASERYEPRLSRLPASPATRVGKRMATVPVCGVHSLSYSRRVVWKLESVSRSQTTRPHCAGRFIKLLHCLTEEKKSFNWDESYQQAFKELKKKLCAHSLAPGLLHKSIWIASSRREVCVMEQYEEAALCGDTLALLHAELVAHGTQHAQPDAQLVRALQRAALALDAADLRAPQDLLQRKRYAFLCLRLISFEFTDEFCLIFYDSLIVFLRLLNSDFERSTGLQELSEFIESTAPLNEKLALLQVLTACACTGTLELGVCARFAASVWRRRLLLGALFSAVGARGLPAVGALTSHVDRLHEFLFTMGVTEWDADDVLESLITFRGAGTDPHFAVDVLIALPFHPEIFYLLQRDAGALCGKMHEFKYSVLSQAVKGFVELLSESYFEILEYILTLPLQIVLALVFKMATSDDFEQMIIFVEMLKYSSIDRSVLVDYLVNMNFGDDVDTLKYKVLFQIIKSIMGDRFSDDAGGACAVPAETGGALRAALRGAPDGLPQRRDLLHALACALARAALSCTDALATSLETIRTVIWSVEEPQKILDLVHALEILDEYKVNFTKTEFSKMFSEFTRADCEPRLHKLVVEHSFSGTYEKSAERLFDELEDSSPGLTTHVSGLFIDVQNVFNGNSRILPNGGLVRELSREQIKSWISLLATRAVDDAEKLAVLRRAAKVTSGLEVRDVQMLAVVTIVKSNVGKGRLCQVHTGEGKTLVIALAAAFKALSGHKVDIYTSSPLLAVPQSREFADFFKLCGVSVNNNVAPNSDYNYDVIYGTNNSFQRDVLQDEFRKSGVRKLRGFDVAIVDEVDNMLIDGNNWILKLSCDMPAMDHLESLLAAIYIQVNAVVSALVEKNGDVYFREEEDVFEEDGSVKQEIRYRDFKIEGSKRDFIVRCAECHIRKLIRDTGDAEVEDGYPEIKIPKHLRKVVTELQIRNWIESAVNSIFDYVQNEDYILEGGKVVIVDVTNTGVLKKNSHWSNGLHQFLQIKHGAKIEPESFTSNFISNVALFTRYSSIYGLTGTLGSNETRTFLSETYNVDFALIPAFKVMQHKKLKPIIVNDLESWYYEIARNCIQKLRNGRAVLIIMNFIRETEELAKVFREHFQYQKSKIKMYKTDDDADVVNSTLSPGDVIITTNIAGRGTDIKLKKSVEDNGGLHVCLTFLPKNSRVEKQNIGRTSRKGNRGTSQLILHVSGPTIPNDIADLKRIRSQKEKSSIEQARSIVRKVKIKDKIFREFCGLLNIINGRNSFVKMSELKSVEEQFAVWLQLHEDSFDDDLESQLHKFNLFKQSILKDDSGGRLIKNPYMHVELGNKYLSKKEFEKAVTEYTEAIDLDRDFAENAFYNRAWAYLQRYGHNVKENRYYIDKAIEDLKNARKLIHLRELDLHLLQTASKSEVFSEQVTNKLNLYNIQKNVIEMAIGPDIKAINSQLKEIEHYQNKTKDITPELKNKLTETRKKLIEDKENIGVIGRALENDRDIKIEPLAEDFIPKEDKKKYEDELEEFERNGWLPGFKVTEVKPIDWVSVISLLGIGLGQLIIGAAITVFSLGAGANFGMAFISEGISDIITAVKDGIINRDFDWATWALMKIISVTVSIVCAGLKAIKDVARTTYSGVKNLATSGFKAFNKVTKEGFKIAAKKLGFELAKGVGKEIATQLVNYGIDKSLIPKIEEAIIEIVRGPIEKNLRNNTKVQYLLKLDEENKNHVFENQIRAIGQKLLAPKTNSRYKILAMHTANCFTGNLGLGTIHKIITILKGSVDFVSFTSDFINEFNKAVDKIHSKEQENIDNKQTENMQGEQSKEETQRMHQAAYKDEHIDLSKVGQQHEQVQLTRKRCTASDLSNDFAAKVSTNMIQIMKGNIVSPVTQMAVSYSIDGLSSRVNKCLESETEKFKAGKRICDDNNRKYDNASGINELQSLSIEDFEEVNRLIDNFEEGGPLKLFHLGALSKAADKSIEVYDHNGELMFSVRSKAGGEPAKFQYHGDDDVGHFTLLGKAEPNVAGTGDNMCAFNCMAQLSGKAPDQLKRETVNILRRNPHVLASRLNDIKMIETCRGSVFDLRGGATYYGKSYVDAKQYIESSEGSFGFRNKSAGHPEVHISYKGDPKVKFAMLSDVIKRKIIVNNKKGNKMYSTGNEYDGDPIILQFNVDKKDPARSYFSAPDGNEKLTFYHDDDMKLYSYVGKVTNKSAQGLKTETRSRLDSLPVPRSATCVENKPATSKLPSGFFCKEDEALVLHYALISKPVQDKLDKLNSYRTGQKGTDSIKVPLTLSAQQLNLPRPVQVGQWMNGKLICACPLDSVFVLLQHYDGQQTNPKAQVQIQTIYPPLP
ncbi:uncharacterized protein [Battus philenor]|uniref:uncharacterized protein n=1 Tax=Battus philenor TaxID=42288 RepID=UPI0035CF2420